MPVSSTFLCWTPATRNRGLMRKVKTRVVKKKATSKMNKRGTVSKTMRQCQGHSNSGGKMELSWELVTRYYLVSRGKFCSSCRLITWNTCIWGSWYLGCPLCCNTNTVDSIRKRAFHLSFFLFRRLAHRTSWRYYSGAGVEKQWAS